MADTINKTCYKCESDFDGLYDGEKMCDVCREEECFEHEEKLTKK